MIKRYAVRFNEVLDSDDKGHYVLYTDYAKLNIEHMAQDIYIEQLEKKVKSLEAEHKEACDLLAKSAVYVLDCNDKAFFDEIMEKIIEWQGVKND